MGTKSTFFKFAGLAVKKESIVQRNRGQRLQMDQIISYSYIAYDLLLHFCYIQKFMLAHIPCVQGETVRTHFSSQLSQKRNKNLLMCASSTII